MSAVLVEDTTTIPGKVLSPPRLREMQQSEDYAAKWLGRLAYLAAAQRGVPAELATQAAANAVAANPCTFMGPMWLTWAFSMDALPLLVQMSLQRKQPATTPNEAASLADVDDPMGLRHSLLLLWGVIAKAKEKKDDGNASQPNPSTTTPSSTSSPVTPNSAV